MFWGERDRRLPALRSPEPGERRLYESAGGLESSRVAVYESIAAVCTRDKMVNSYEYMTRNRDRQSCLGGSEGV